ncbi:MAG: outer membrane beta-barrel protein [Gemmatimonadales bacterium]
MRVLTIVGVGLSCAAASLNAQRSDQIELGGFGTYTRYDRLYGLPNRVGAGLRFGYFISDRLGVELEADYLGPSQVAGDPSRIFHYGSASLVFNFHAGDRASIYFLGGFSRMDIGTTPPYAFAENGVHGGGGARILITDRLALRVEGRAFYRPESDLTGQFAGHVIGSAGISYFTSAPRRGQYAPRGTERHHQWYWGGQGGLILYQTNVQGNTFDPIVGGHWLITSKRTALYVAYEQALFLTDAQAVIVDPASTTSSVGPGFRDVTFNSLRRIVIGLAALPAQRAVEPIIGGGFALMQVLDPVVDCTSCASNSEVFGAQDLAEDAASKAFFWLKGGLQINYSRRLTLFGHYMVTSAAEGFLLKGNTHTIQGGVRYSLGTAKEGITERH